MCEYEGSLEVSTPKRKRQGSSDRGPDRCFVGPEAVPRPERGSREGRHESQSRDAREAAWVARPAPASGHPSTAEKLRDPRGFSFHRALREKPLPTDKPLNCHHSIEAHQTIGVFTAIARLIRVSRLPLRPIAPFDRGMATSATTSGIALQPLRTGRMRRTGQYLDRGTITVPGRSRPAPT